jgi:hypothetical protein
VARLLGRSHREPAAVSAPIPLDPGPVSADLLSNSFDVTRAGPPGRRRFFEGMAIEQ